MGLGAPAGVISTPTTAKPCPCDWQGVLMAWGKGGVGRVGGGSQELGKGGYLSE